MHDTNCPYCDAEVEINHDDGKGYSENEIHQHECDNCGKTFVFTTAIIYSYNTQQADCLNGEEHNYEPTNTYPRKHTRMQCTMCGEQREPTGFELSEILLKDI